MITTERQERQEWLAVRKKGIGGSDVAAIFGLSKWKTPFELWQEKTGRVNNDDQESEYMHFGNVLEQVIADEFSRRNDIKVQRRNQMFQKDGVLFANIDRYIVGGGVLECKTADKWTAHLWGDAETDDIPEYYLTQCQHYMYVTEYDFAFLAVLIGGNEYRQYPIKYDNDLAEFLGRKSIEWWNDYVIKDVPPPAVQEDNLTEYYKCSPGTSVTITPAIAAKLEDLKCVKEKMKILKDEKDGLEFSVKDFIGNNEILLDASGKTIATFKESSSNRIDTKALRHDFPEVADQVTNTSTSRRFLIK